MQRDGELEGIRDLLRTLAEVQAGPFYALWIHVMEHVRKPRPELALRIFRVGDADNAALRVFVSVERADGREVTWSVGLTTGAESLLVDGTIDVGSNDDGYREVFSRSDQAADAASAATLIRSFAADVCAERRWLTG